MWSNLWAEYISLKIQLQFRKFCDRPGKKTVVLYEILKHLVAFWDFYSVLIFDKKIWDIVILWVETTHILKPKKKAK